MKFEVCLKVRRWVDVNKTSDEETSPHFCLQVATDSTFFWRMKISPLNKWYKTSLNQRLPCQKRHMYVFRFPMMASTRTNRINSRGSLSSYTFLCCFSQAGSRRPSLSHSSSCKGIHCFFVWLEVTNRAYSLWKACFLKKFSSVYMKMKSSPAACTARLPPLEPQTAVDSRIEPSEEDIMLF